MAGVLDAIHLFLELEDSRQQRFWIKVPHKVKWKLKRKDSVTSRAGDLRNNQRC